MLKNTKMSCKDKEHYIEQNLTHKHMLEACQHELKQTKADLKNVAGALEDLISLAERCDGWESFPSQPLDDAYDLLDKASLLR